MRVARLRPHGQMRFAFGDPERYRLVVSIFSTSCFSGRVRGRAGILRWYSEDCLPFDQMWPDDKYCVPLVLAGGSVDGTCVFDESGDRMLAWRFRVTWTGPAAGPFEELPSSADRPQPASH